MRGGRRPRTGNRPDGRRTRTRGGERPPNGVTTRARRVQWRGMPAFLPFVRRWFESTFTEPTPPQREGWEAIASGRDTLIVAPTGSGKTLAAFLWTLDHLHRLG